MQIGTGVQALLRFCLSNLKVVMLVLLMGEFMMYAVEMGSGVPCSMTIGSDI
jgi:hypothetical protein